MADTANENHHDSSTDQVEIPETRRERRRRHTREALLGAGVDVIARVGVSGLTISSITEAADVALGSFYNHFEDREHYLRELFVEQTFEWLDDVRSTRRAGFEDEADRLAAATIMVVRRSQERPAWGIFIAEALAAAELTNSDLIADLIVPVIEGGSERGSFTVSDPVLAARLVLGLIRQSLIHLSKSEGGADIESDMAATVLRMLGTQSGAVQRSVDRAIENLRTD